MDLSKIGSAVRTARKFGMSDSDILRELLRSVGPPNHRREIVVAWGKAVGLDSKTALQQAHRSALIPTSHPPRALRSGTLPGTTQGNDPQ